MGNLLPLVTLVLLGFTLSVPADAKPKVVPVRNSYSGSPQSFSAPAPRRTPLAPLTKRTKRRVQLDMTRPYGKVSPSPTLGPERGIASEIPEL